MSLSFGMSAVFPSLGSRSIFATSWRSALGKYEKISFLNCFERALFMTLGISMRKAYTLAKIYHSWVEHWKVIVFLCFSGKIMHPWWKPIMISILPTIFVPSREGLLFGKILNRCCVRLDGGNKFLELQRFKGVPKRNSSPGTARRWWTIWTCSFIDSFSKFFK